MAERFTTAAFRALNRRQKYGAKATELDGYRFDSRKEARRYKELKLMEHAGEIKHLNVHPRFPLFTINSERERVPILTKRGRTYEYVGDFAFYTTKDGKFHVEDVKTKPTLTQLSKLKIAILEASTGWTVELIGV